MAISFQPVQLGLGMVFVLVPAILLVVILKRRLKAVIALLVVSLVILTAFTCFVVFNYFYPEVIPGDNIRGEDGSLIMGYYHNETRYKTVKNYDELDTGYKRELDKKFELYHPLYESGFENYRNIRYSKYLNGMIGAGIGGLFAIIILIFFITRTDRRKRIKEEMDLRDIFS